MVSLFSQFKKGLKKVKVEWAFKAFVKIKLYFNERNTIYILTLALKYKIKKKFLYFLLYLKFNSIV